MIARPSRLLLTVLLLGSTAAFAQNIKPGLWEVQSKMGGDPEMEKAMAQMQKQLAAMPPAQRKQMEAMMGKQGVSVNAGGGMTMKICITPEMAARQQMPTQTQGDCTTNVGSRSGSTMKMSFVCKNPPSKGEGTYTLQGDTGYNTHMTIEALRDGKPHVTTIDGQGKWLSADCGAVKPIQVPAATPKQ